MTLTDLKEEPRLYVLLTFDLDAETLWTSRPGGDEVGPVMLSQGTYGPRTAVPRILDLLDRHRVPATFFVPGAVAEEHRESCRSILDHGHEIGHHGYLHERPDRTPADEERRTFVLALEALERELGVKPKGYRAPAWELSDITLDLLRENGFEYTSNMMDRDRPYEHPAPAGTDPLCELPVSWLLDDAALFMYGLSTSGWPIMEPRTVARMWTDEFDGLYREGGGQAYVLTMHPQIIGRPSRLAALEGLIDHIKGSPGAVFLTGGTATEVWRRFNA